MDSEGAFEESLSWDEGRFESGLCGRWSFDEVGGVDGGRLGTAVPTWRWAIGGAGRKRMVVMDGAAIGRLTESGALMADG